MEKPPADLAAVHDWVGFMNAFQTETPRSAVIIGAAFLDAQLRELIANFLVDDKKVVADFLGDDDKADRPLSAFSARTKAAYCLGLISKDEYDDLNLIRRIRNRFAHKLHDISFDNKEISNWCHLLKTAKKLPVSNHLTSHRDLFVASVALLSIYIGVKAGSVAEERRQVPVPFAIGQYVQFAGNEGASAEPAS